MLQLVDRDHPFQPNGLRRNAIVSIVIGDEYKNTWESACKESWLRYADLHGYDIVVITDYLDDSPRGKSRSPSWQKLLVLEQPWAQLYEQIVWIDADIVISGNARNILDSVPDPAKVGICRLGGQMSDAEKQIYFERIYDQFIAPESAAKAWRIHEEHGFRSMGIESTPAPMFNCGVLVLSPRHHRQLLLDVYAQEEGAHRLYEQPNLSYKLFETGQAEVISPRFNWSVHDYMMVGISKDETVGTLISQLRHELDNSYFLHFCGSMPVLNAIAESNRTKGETWGISPAKARPAAVEAGAPADPIHPGDYISPNLVKVFPDRHFPNMVIGDPTTISWPYIRPSSPHNWYVDKRIPRIGFLSRDEAHIVYNTALQARGMPALEIGCFLGWSACHLALAGVSLDIVDPLLAESAVEASVIESLTAAGVAHRCRLIKGGSPAAVEFIGAKENKRWNLIFIDGDHESPGPVQDADVCERFAADDCIILFHDLYAPAVAEGLRYYKRRGWKTLVYNTSQVVGVAWRGAMSPVEHIPDPRLGSDLPGHLSDLLDRPALNPEYRAAS